MSASEAAYGNPNIIKSVRISSSVILLSFSSGPDLIAVFRLIAKKNSYIKKVDNVSYHGSHERRLCLTRVGTKITNNHVLTVDKNISFCCETSKDEICKL